MAPPLPGFDARHVSPADAVVTLRSLRRRFAEAFDQADAPDEVTGPDSAGLSPLDRAAWVAGVLPAIGSGLRQVLLSDDPDVELPAVDAPTAAGATDVNAVLARLAESAGALADQMAGVHGEDWSRQGHSHDQTVSALDLARLAVTISIDQLRAAQAALGAELG